ncbi:RNA-splicing factor [Chamberlinius hualienensis]
MGGGDLNLKKSWHPTTLRNMERVWKAEQKHEAEQKKIEELQKELASEKAREEIRQFAEDQGILKKKSNRLDWMYEGAGSMINREEYLVGKSVDKTFEQNEFGVGKSELDSIPESVCRTSETANVNITVDLANKIREDPMLTIRKQEDDSRRELLNNPVRMKQLQEMLRGSGSKKHKKHKKKSKRSSDDDDSSDKSPEPSRHKDRTRRSSKNESRHHRDSSRRDSKIKSRHSSSRRSRSRSPVYRDRREKDKRTRSPPRSPKYRKETKEMDDNERDRKLREMMENAKWRDDQRSQRMRKHIDELKKEVEQQVKMADADFITPMLNKVAATGSVSGRIKSNIYNIQRTKGDLEKSFVRR